jgi:hypothetical protein
VTGGTDGQQICPSCGLVSDEVDGPVDPYDASSPSCWEMFGSLHLMGTSQLAVDTYMAQHPGVATPAGRRSVLTHLVGLHLALHDRESPERIRKVLGVVFPGTTTDVPGLRNAPDLRGLTVADVVGAPPRDRGARETDWACWVWDAWSAEHPRVLELAELARRRHF